MQLDDSYTSNCCSASPDTSEHDELESDSEQELEGRSGYGDAGEAATSEEQQRRQQQEQGDDYEEQDMLQKDSDMQGRLTLEHSALSAKDVSGPA